MGSSTAYSDGIASRVAGQGTGIDDIEDGGTEIEVARFTGSDNGSRNEGDVGV